METDEGRKKKEPVVPRAGNADVERGSYHEKHEISEMKDAIQPCAQHHCTIKKRPPLPQEAVWMPEQAAAPDTKAHDAGVHPDHREIELVLEGYDGGSRIVGQSASALQHHVHSRCACHSNCKQGQQKVRKDDTPDWS